MKDVVVVEKLSKKFLLGETLGTTMLRESIVRFIKSVGTKRSVPEELWALKDVSFDIPRGQVVGIIGRNGAGKSTLLKILAKITFPTSGRVAVRGRVASLLEVGTGFHEELTGRENIFLNGAILGMTKREVDQKLDAIVDFAGVDRFVDTPIKRYSSGMRLRLGFAVAAHLDPDVLIVDEVLAVGDAGFQKKCIAAMDELRGGGRTVLFVSHNMAAVENLCSRGIWIDDGQIRADGDAADIISRYMASYAAPSSKELELVRSGLGSGKIRFEKIEYLTSNEELSSNVRCGDAVIIRLHYKVAETVLNPSFGFRVYSELGTLISETDHVRHGIQFSRVDPGEGYIDVEIASLNLLPGRYSMSLWVTGVGGQPVYDGDVRTTLHIEVGNASGTGLELTSRMGIVYFPQRWGRLTSKP